MSEEPMVERLEQLEAAATPGPWKISDKTPVVVVVPGAGANGHDWQFDSGDRAGITHNAELIVTMRNDLPALLSQLREQRAVVDAAVDAVLERSDDPGALRKAVLRYLRDRAEAAALAPDTEGDA